MRRCLLSFIIVFGFHYQAQSWSELLNAIILLEARTGAVTEYQRYQARTAANRPSNLSGDQQGTCEENVPDDIFKIANDMRQLREECAPLGESSSIEKPIIVADLSDTGGKIFSFNEVNGQLVCTKSYDSNSWGTGAGTSGPPKHCADDGSKITPAGLHLLTEHDGQEKWNKDNSLKMLGLETQGSEDRGVLVHGGHGSASCSTHGCSGMADEDFDDLKDNQNALGGMWYNYFGSTPAADGCKDDSGYSETAEMPTCEDVTKNLREHPNLTDPANLQSNEN